MCIRDRCKLITSNLLYFNVLMITKNKDDKDDIFLPVRAVSYTHLDVYKRQVLMITKNKDDKDDIFLPVRENKVFCAQYISFD